MWRLRSRKTSALAAPVFFPSAAGTATTIFHLNRFLAIFAPRPASLIASACATTALPSDSSSWNRWAIGFSARWHLREITCTDKEDDSEKKLAQVFQRLAPDALAEGSGAFFFSERANLLVRRAAGDQSLEYPGSVVDHPITRIFRCNGFPRCQREALSKFPVSQHPLGRPSQAFGAGFLD